jgi:hypothetical protein
MVSFDGKYVLDNFSSPENPRTIQLIETSSQKVKVIKQRLATFFSSQCCFDRS